MNLSHSQSDIDTNPREVIGANNPPGPLDHAKDAMAELSAFLKETPVLESFAQAKIASGWVERTRIALSEAREDRDSKTRPLNDKLSAIRALYDLVREKSKTNAGGALEAAYTILKQRLTKFSLDEEAKRNAEAQRLADIAAEAERVARAAEATEQEAIKDAEVGVCTDVGAAIAHADGTFHDFSVARRAAAVADRNVTVRLGSIMGGRSISMRAKPATLTINDAVAAVKSIVANAGHIPPRLDEAIKTCARELHAAYEEWPEGITATIERGL
jgi:hypothetical protein